MIESFTAYLESVVQQAADRENTKYHSIASYLAARHENIGTRPSYAVMEFDLDLDDDIIYHPIIVELTENITELILLDNVSRSSSCSYAKVLKRLDRLGHGLV